MATEKIIPIFKERIPTIVSYDRAKQSYVIGDEARMTGLEGRTIVFGFKPDLGKGDAEFSKHKKYWYYFYYGEGTGTQRERQTETFTAKEATVKFLQELLKEKQIPEQIVVGEPAVRDSSWKENFRRHMREVFEDMGLNATPVFFPEPFAVFQYFKNEVLKDSREAQTVLIIDIGGGTFNSCIIRTTEQGYLARGGATSVPLGLQAEVCGGSEIDKALLKEIVKKAKKRGIVWKDDPIARAEKEGSSSLLHIEDAKIRLSELIGNSARLSEDQSDKKVEIKLEKGTLHPEEPVSVILTGEDLKSVVRHLWRTRYGKILIDTVNEAKQKLGNLGVQLEKLDKVLVAGGSSRLPFMKEEVLTVLPTMVTAKDVLIGKEVGKSVALGIAYECIEQTKRNPDLRAGGIAPCVLNDLYIGFKKDRKSELITPKISRDGIRLKSGQLFASPFVIEDFTLNYEFAMPFDVNGKIFYVFSDKPFDFESEVQPLNLNHPVFAVDTSNRIIKRWKLRLDIQKNGSVKPTFMYKEKGKGAQKRHKKAECPEFFLPNFKLEEGDSYLGVDFGTSNSYVAQVMRVIDERVESQYPEFTVKPKIVEKLRLLEVDIERQRAGDGLNYDIVENYANNQILSLVFHSNKIEGNPLTRGETEQAIELGKKSRATKQQREAINLEAAHRWMLEHRDSYLQEPQGFIRQLNSIILEGIESEGGSYRKKEVTLSGMDFVPPHSSAVSGFMERLSEEIKEGPKDRSILEFAGAIHTKLVSIHPFVDANGRTARLLMNTILLCNGLPVVVVNYADKERYLSSLAECNAGDMTSFVDFLIECFHVALEDLIERRRTDGSEPQKISDAIEECILPQELTDPIGDALKELGVVEGTDPLELIMQEKVAKQRKVNEANYQAWQQGYKLLQSELEKIIKDFNDNSDYRRAGYSLKLSPLDILPLAKYLDICIGRKAPKTWFLGIDLVGPSGKEKLLFFFDNSCTYTWAKANVNPVCLTLARHDSDSYRALENEPISLRRIGYSEGELIFLHENGDIVRGQVTMTLKMLLAETIKNYL